MNRIKCGAPTKAGSPCNFGRVECPHHGPNARPRSATDGKPEPGVPPPEGRDISAITWWAIDGVALGWLETARASVLASLLRVATGLPPEDEADALKEVELRGRLMHGQPPRDDAEWGLAESLFTEEALREFRRWETLLERDAFHGGEELLPGDGARDHGDDPLVVHHEDRV